jgi:hypothetical protein
MDNINGGEPSPQTPTADDKENASNDKKKEQKKKRMQDVIIICVLALVAFLFIAYLASSPEFETRNKITTTIVDDIIDTPANYYIYYTFSVPAGASSARVTGTYEVHGGGLISRIDIYLADTSLCSSPIDCSSYYYVGKDKSFGEVDVYLPTSARSRQTPYYLSFHNIAPLGESKQTEASFKVEIS